MCCTNILGCILVTAGIAAAVICVVGIAIPFWAIGDTDITDTVALKRVTYEGLWQKCTLVTPRDDDPDCENMWSDKIDNYTSGKKAVLAMCLIGVVLIVAFTVVMVLHLTLCGTIDILTKIAAFLAIGAGAFILIGIIVYAADGKNDTVGGSVLSGGFGLCLVAAVICILAGGLSFFVD